MESSGQGNAQATWYGFGFGKSIMRGCCIVLRLFIRVIYDGKCILLRRYWRRPRGVLQGKGEGLDNPLFAEGTRYELRGIRLLCGKFVIFSTAWNGERLAELALAKMCISSLAHQGSNKKKKGHLHILDVWKMGRCEGFQLAETRVD